MGSLILEQLAKYVLYGVMIAFLLRIAPLRRMADALPRRQRRVLAAIFGLILFAQIVESKYETYPFVKWGMYSGTSGEIEYFEYEGVRPDGTTATFPLAHLLRIHQPLCPTCSKRVVWQFRDMGNARLRAKSEAELAEIVDLYERSLRAAWGVYAARHPEADFTEVRVRYGEYAAADYVDEGSIRLEEVWTVPLRPETTDGD